MKNPGIGYRTLRYIVFVSIITFFSSITVLSGPALAHQGHAGKQVVFLKKESALKQMLPAGAKVVQRKEILDRSRAERAKKESGVDLDEGGYTYYLARDSKTGTPTGAAIVSEVEYMHGEVSLAIGIDTKGNVTKAAILSVNEKYVPDIKGAVGTGYLRQLEGVTIKKLIIMTDDASNSALATETVYSQMRDMAVLLSIFLTSSQ